MAKKKSKKVGGKKRPETTKKQHKETSKKSPLGTIATAVVVLGLVAFVVFMAVKQPSATQKPVDIVKTTTSTVETTAPSDNTGTTTPSGNKIKMTILTDARCTTCDTDQFVDSLKQIFPGLEVKKLDYNNPDGKKLYQDTQVEVLPALLFDKEVQNDENFGNIENFVDEKGDYLSLRVGSSFNPTAEICDNGIDDNGDGAIDCDDSECQGSILACSKRATPTVELFVMSYCPYGTQTEKGIIPVLDLLGDKIDFTLRFVYYAMHGEKEVREELNQYCIREEQPDKLLPYLKCFLEASDGEGCLATANIDTAKLNSCTAAADTEFDVMANFNNKDQWLNGNYPLVNFDKVDNENYGIGGSPGLVVNGIKVDSGRSPALLLDTICSGFAVKPAECSQQLNATSPTPGFGWATGSAPASAGSCG